MKKYSKVKKDAIAHYTRMIKWAEKQPKRERPYTKTMEREIGENWWGHYCSYCQSPEYECLELEDCPLGTDEKCCKGLWYKMRISKTWGTWVKRAKEVREYIRKNG